MRAIYLLLLVVAVGCGQSAAVEEAAPKAWQHYAKLPGLSRSTHGGLQAELTLLREEKATPLLLAAQAGFAEATAAKSRGPDLTDPRVALRNAYPPLSRGVLVDRLDRIDGGGPLRFGPVETEDLRQLLQQTTANRQRFARAVELVAKRPLVNPGEGVAADLDYLAALEIGCRMELLAAAEGLASGRTTAAVETLQIHFAVVQRLAEQPSVAVRLAAANRRADGLRLLQEVVLHRSITANDLQRCHGLVEQQLGKWPSDAVVWSGDRARGLHVYELVRDGHYLSLLDRDEVRRLEERQLVPLTGQAVLRGVDADQHFYLTAMRQMIQSCQLPHFARTPVLAEIRRDLGDLERTPNYPIVAAELLLTDFELVHQRLAEDRARAEAWLLALRLASREGSPANVNPLTGEPFHVETIDRTVIVSRILPDDDQYRVIAPSL